MLRRRAEPDAAAFAAAPLSRDELARRFGADPAELAAVRDAVAAAGAEVVAADAATRLVRVRGQRRRARRIVRHAVARSAAEHGFRPPGSPPAS